MNLGDSITAGFGLDGAGGFIDEFRGRTFASGADKNTSSIYNFLKYYQPEIYGGSTSYHLVELPGFPYYETDYLNAAQSNAASPNLPYQLDRLTTVLKSAPTNYTSDWKLLNVFIGANDACTICYDDPLPTPAQMKANFKKNIEATVEYSYQNFPRTLMNFIPLFNVSGIYAMAEQYDYCRAFHDIIPVECACLFAEDKDRVIMDTSLTVYREAIVEVSNEWKAKNLPEFNVIYQPLTEDVNVKTSWIEYFSTLDCFHPSAKGHELLAIANWNALITPWSKKKHDWDPTRDDTLMCPDDTTRIWTS